MTARAANQIGAEKVHSPTVTMATDKGWHCRAELETGGRKDKRKVREAGERRECLLPPSILPVLSVQFINIKSYVEDII